jgi:hypothetical protein
VSDQEPLAVAIKAAIQAELPAGVNVYDVDEVPGATGSSNSDPTPARYVTIELGRRYNANEPSNADTVELGALTTHYRAANVTLCRNLRKAVTAALENRAYDLPGGDTVGPFSHQFDNGFIYAADGWSAFDLWNF